MISKKGFTLIELLVVIAIIGILASIVLVTFPTAQGKAKDARIISALSQARTAMTLIYDSTGSYATFTCAQTDMAPLCADVLANNPGSINPAIVVNGADACIASALNTTGGGGFYCADDQGVAKRTAALCDADGTCP